MVGSDTDRHIYSNGNAPYQLTLQSRPVVHDDVDRESSVDAVEHVELATG